MKMKGLLAFIALLAFASAKPTKDYYYDSETVLPTQVIKLDNKVFNNPMVGECTVKDHAYSVVKCQKAFYLSFRKDKKTPCEQRFLSLKNCYQKTLRKCYEKILPRKTLDNLMVRSSSAFQRHKKMQCGGAGFDIAKYFKQPPRRGDCPKGTMVKLGSCAQTWYQLFRKNRGSLQLCYKYQKYVDCAKLLIDKCTFGSRKHAWAFNKDLNPFCDKEQLKSLKRANIRPPGKADFFGSRLFNFANGLV